MAEGYLDGKDLQIKAHDTKPHKPPADTTANLLLLGLSPPNVVMSCFELS